MTTVKCHVRQSNGKYKRYKSKDGAKFKDKKGKTYDPPNIDNHEILELENFWGMKRFAFYRQGEAQAIPLNKAGTWSGTTEKDEDVLVRITAEALLEATMADQKATAALGGLLLVIVLQIIHMVIG